MEKEKEGDAMREVNYYIYMREECFAVANKGSS